VSHTQAPFGGATLMKGHGTRNDFIMVIGPDAATAPVPIQPSVIAQLCDRATGVGADGLIRVVPPHTEGNGDLWFMDYRNADGSLAQMCGNGARVFARVLLDRGWVTPDTRGSFSIQTLSGVHRVHTHSDDTITIDMGPASFPQVDLHPVVSVYDAPNEAHTDSNEQRSWPATSVYMPNPHAVVFVNSVDQAGSLHWAPDVTPPQAFPEGVNVEFVHLIAPGHLQMRVYERGAGETLSCGTGACAAMVAAREKLGSTAPMSWQVDVPGGLLTVTQRPDGIDLRGPAVLTGEIPASELQFLAV